MNPKFVITIVVFMLLAIFLFNFAIKVFNTLDAWLGIGIGFMGAIVLLYVTVKILTKK